MSISDDICFQTLWDISLSLIDRQTGHALPSCAQPRVDLNINNLDGQRVLYSRFQATEGGNFLQISLQTYLPELILSLYLKLRGDLGTVPSR